MKLDRKMWITWRLYSYNVGPAKIKRMSRDELIILHRQIDICLDDLDEFIAELKENPKTLPEIGARFYINYCPCPPCIKARVIHCHAIADAEEALQQPYVSVEDL